MPGVSGVLCMIRVPAATTVDIAWDGWDDDSPRARVEGLKDRRCTGHHQCLCFVCVERYHVDYLLLGVPTVLSLIFSLFVELHVRK